jgi:hypothetical protein
VPSGWRIEQEVPASPGAEPDARAGARRHDPFVHVRTELPSPFVAPSLLTRDIHAIQLKHWISAMRRRARVRG